MDEDSSEKNKEVKPKKVVKKSIEYQTEDLVRDALRKFISEKVENRKTDDDIEAMVATCSEFLKCFVILGYDFEGKSIAPIFYAKNQLDADALGQHLQKFFLTGNY